MSGTHNVVMGDRGRLVIPAELRERAGMVAGTPLVLIETADGIVLLTRPQLKGLVRSRLSGPSMVDELLAERRTAASMEDER